MEKSFLCGKWMEFKNKKAVINPYTQEIIAYVTLVPKDKINQAINYLKGANNIAQGITSYERYCYLMSLSENIRKRKNDFARSITLESGKPIKDSLHEVERAIQTLIFSAEEAKRIEGNIQKIDIVPKSKNGMILLNIPEPYGTIGAISPFNYPLNLVLHKFGPAVATGNTFLLKPSLKTPLTAIELFKTLENLNFPMEILSLITCVDEDIIEIIKNDSIDILTFTGGADTGKKILRDCGIKKVIMELGSSDPMLIFEDHNNSDLEDIIIHNVFDYMGQRCTAAKRLIVEDSIAEKLINTILSKVKDLKSGDPMNENTDIGPLINEESAKRVDNLVNLSISKGAKLITGGHRNLNFYTPTILDHVTQDMPIAQEETFGPVCPVIRFTEISEAINIANSTMYGLQAGVFTSDYTKFKRITKELYFGTILWNEGPSYRVDYIPFGGRKMSGLHEEGVKSSCKEYIRFKRIIFKM